MKYTKRDYKNKVEMPKDIVLKKAFLKNTFDDYVIRRIIIKELSDLFTLNHSNHINLTGTAYSFYVRRWQFGYVKRDNIRGKTAYSVKYVDFDHLINHPKISNDIKEKLLYHLDFFLFE